MNGYADSENFKAISRVVSVATVISVDLATARAKVEFGKGAESASLPWVVPRAGSISSWAAPSVGEQVVCAAPEGNTANAVIIGALYSASNPPISDKAEEVRLKMGESELVMDGASITLKSNGSELVLDAAGVRINGARIDLN